ncbi:hypothetical protein A2617_04660 [Candidatus Daviesbacteria bacterium RIFOXYD1_FULL_41_10]|uniref:Uncharacterized protein n=2 Tax=Patescibacteria group TaxID=1783273 RepID=A0A1F5N1Q2_9BACT|nr:MAG: hypothetical protein UW78_C0007G0006 [Candidatus Azambacteria bacterium GW2011_GWA1_44_9]OGE71551.1 MAG: hypothetical protein A2617_04660 [Candidatus Daviesbacteria bacterium RIFOXYD1_FULL_41_10]
MNFQELSQKYPVIEEFQVKKIKLSPLGIDILGQGSFYQDPTIAPVDGMIRTADLISGHRFLNLDLLKKFKAKIGKEKDLKDIDLIDRYPDG